MSIFTPALDWHQSPGPGAQGLLTQGFATAKPPPSESRKAQSKKEQEALARSAQAPDPMFPTLWQRFSNDAVPLLLPMAMFVIMLLSSALMEARLPTKAALIFFIVVSVYFIVLARSRDWRFLGFICLIVTLLANALGTHCYTMLTSEMVKYNFMQGYANVIPTNSPGSTEDAGTIDFAVGTRVDSSRGIGYRSRDLYCVAPVVAEQEGTQVGYWAAGLNCCDERSNFRCGDVTNPSILGGVVVVEKEEVEMYDLAARMSAATFDLALPEDRQFVRWGTDVKAYKDILRADVRTFLLGSSFGYLGAVFLAMALMAMGGFSLASGKPSRHNWHPDEVQKLQFGMCSCASGKPRYDRERFVDDLLYDRNYWSGEVLYDWAFHISNTHAFLGPFLCHPYHPFSAWERLFVLAMLIPITLFPVGLISALLDQSSILRPIVVLIAVTAPRNIMLGYLKQVAASDETLIDTAEAKAANEEHRAKVQAEAFKWEMTLFAGLFLFTVCLSVFCGIIICLSQPMALLPFLWQNADGLAWAFVLQPVLELIMPHHEGHASWKDWAYGWFNSWRRQRDTYEAYWKPDHDGPGPNPAAEAIRANHGYGTIFQEGAMLRHTLLHMRPSEAKAERLAHSSQSDAQTAAKEMRSFMDSGMSGKTLPAF